MPDITVGYEFEVARNGARVLDELHKRGAVMHDYLCPYHGCGDTCCDHADTEYLFSAQEDCSVDAEFPSRTYVYGSDRMYEAMDVMEAAAVCGGAYLEGDSGMHVHVVKPGGERRGETDDPNVRPFTTRELATWRLARIFQRYQGDIQEIAAGARERVRGYNCPTELHMHGSFTFADGRSIEEVFWTDPLENGPMIRCTDWNGRETEHSVTNVAQLWGGSYLDTERHDHTYEFRLWNATKAAWRQQLAVGLSVAMVLAATDGVNVTKDDGRCVEDVLGPYLDKNTWAGILRQRYSKGGVDLD